MKIVQFQTWHYYSFLARLIPRPMADYRSLEKHMTDPTHAVTWMEGERVIAIGGVAEMWRGSGEAWALLSAAALAKPVALRKVAEAYLAGAQQNFWRIQATVRADFREGNRWVQSLGFSHETPTGPMKGYGPDGADYELYAMEGKMEWAQQH